MKSLLQLMGAAENGRDVLYFTFGDEKLRDDIFDVFTLLKNKNVSVGSLYNVSYEKMHFWLLYYSLNSKFGRSHNNRLQFDRCKIPLDGFFWDSNHFFFLDGFPFVKERWCKIEIVILLFYIRIAWLSLKVCPITYLHLTQNVIM